MIDAYDWADGREAIIRFGPPGAPVVIVAPALFEESNRTRALLTDMLRRLGVRGIAGVLPDLPGTGESLVATADARLADWRGAFAAAAAAAGAHAIVGLRGGALVDGDADLPRWHLAPVTGAAVVRDMVRARRAAVREGGEPLDLDGDAPGPPVELAGNLIAREMLAALDGAVVSPAGRTVRLQGDARPADRHVPGAPLWRRSEPAQDSAMAQTLADDIAEWMGRCGN